MLLPLGVVCKTLHHLIKCADNCYNLHAGYANKSENEMSVARGSVSGSSASMSAILINTDCTEIHVCLVACKKQDIQIFP